MRGRDERDFRIEIVRAVNEKTLLAQRLLPYSQAPIPVPGEPQRILVNLFDTDDESSSERFYSFGEDDETKPGRLIRSDAFNAIPYNYVDRCCMILLCPFILCCPHTDNSMLEMMQAHIFAEILSFFSTLITFAPIYCAMLNPCNLLIACGCSCAWQFVPTTMITDAPGGLPPRRPSFLKICKRIFYFFWNPYFFGLLSFLAFVIGIILYTTHHEKVNAIFGFTMTGVIGTYSFLSAGIRYTRRVINITRDFFDLDPIIPYYPAHSVSLPKKLFNCLCFPTLDSDGHENDFFHDIV
jgi:hypothetical protein